MQYSELTHHDLHMGNIWIQSLSDKNYKKNNFVNIYFINNNQYIVLPFTQSSGFVRLFDWDLSYAPNIHTDDEKKKCREIW